MLRSVILMVKLYCVVVPEADGCPFTQQDGSGWTPLMIAASLKDSEGDRILDLMLRKEADVNCKSNSGQVYPPNPTPH